jgi:hypothetical protein
MTVAITVLSARPQTGGEAEISAQESIVVHYRLDISS